MISCSLTLLFALGAAVAGVAPLGRCIPPPLALDVGRGDVIQEDVVFDGEGLADTLCGYPERRVLKRSKRAEKSSGASMTPLRCYVFDEGVISCCHVVNLNRNKREQLFRSLMLFPGELQARGLDTYRINLSMAKSAGSK